LFGGVFLDLKVLDTLGIGAGDTSLTYKTTLSSTRSNSWIIAPTANTANTYELNYSFIIDQSTGLARTDAYPSDDGFKCYSSLDNTINLYGLASGKFPDRQNFIRIKVNGVEPLAAWLLDNSRDLWNNFRAASDSEEVEQIIGTQMNYNFLVQITAGLDVRYSLMSPLWSPAQFGGLASSVQTSQLQFYLNGYDASLPGGTKTGTAVSAATAGTPTQPTIIPIGQLNEMLKQIDAKISEIETKSRAVGLSEAERKAATDRLGELTAQRKQLLELKTQLQRAAPAPASAAPGQSRGYLIYPPAILPPQ
jgi:hypothetical protein